MEKQKETINKKHGKKMMYRQEKIKKEQKKHHRNKGIDKENTD